jgi:membrane associated rhomboid family serine protease
LQEHGDGITGVCCYAIIISGIHYFRLQLPDDWLSAGRMNAGAVCSGDWWRTVTALTLHVDMYHLLGNLVYGSLFGLFAGRLFGSGVAWFIILIAGALGNGLNAWIQPPAHNAVGASTAIFSCLGILAASAWALRYATELHWARRWAPVLAGVVLLSFTGLGGERTDVLAHITGFVVGLVAGALCARIARLPIIGIAAQLACGTCTALAIIAAWWAAAAAR